MEIRRGAMRGRFENAWLYARFSFNFGGYQESGRERWGPLRAINDDLVAGGGGFAPHVHQDIETINYPLAGRIEHRDSLGNHHVYGRGQVQRMSAGSGIEHSEMNASADSPETHLQIWLLPAKSGGAPACELRSIPDAEKHGQWRIIAAPDGRSGAVTVRQDALLFARILAAGEEVDYRYRPRRLGYLHVVDGLLQLPDGSELAEGDGLCVKDEALLTLHALRRSEVLLFDLPEMETGS